MKLREAAQQALEALEVWRDSLTNPSAIPGWRFSVLGEKAITALRAALVEDAMQRLTDVQQEMEATSRESRQVKPMAYVTGYSKGRCIIEAVDPDWLLPVGMALYRSPLNRKPLTDEEISKIFIYCGRDKETFARAIERSYGIGGEE